MTKTWTTLASAQPQCRCAYFFYSLLRIITDGSESESTYPWPKLCTNINYIAPCAPHYAAAPELLLTAAAVHLCAPVSLLYDLSITTNHRLHIAVGQHYKKSRQITTMKIYRYAFSQYWNFLSPMKFTLLTDFISGQYMYLPTYLVLCWLVTKDD